MTTTPITTHVEDALARMLEQYKNAPRLKAMITKLGEEFQSIEDAFNSIGLARSIATAEGVHLDKLGYIVGAVRPDNVSDYVYRVIIYGRISANVSQGEPENVINTYKLLTQATNVRMEEEFPAAVNLFSDGALDGETLPYVEFYLKKSLPAGVKLVSFGLFSNTIGFGFIENADALGFGDLLDPTIGGGLGSLIS